MSKHEDFKTIIDEIADLNLLNILWKTIDDKEAEKQSLRFIRVFRQYIERLRRIVDDGEPPVEVYSLQDAMKLNKDELAYLAWQFFQWIQYNSDCPAEDCNDFPCEYRQEQRKMCEEKLADGSLDEEGMKDQQRNGYYHQYCDGDQQGCWVKYYLWCFRNGYNPQTGKKDKSNNHK